MAVTLSHLEENSRRIFHTSPLTLLELASMKIASYVWLEKYRKYGKIGDFPRLNLWHLEYDKLQLHIMYNVPQQIRTMIDSSLDLISRELEWWYINSKNSLSILPYDQICARFDLVVFAGDGTVHVRDTIANFFQDDSLSDVIKFEIACVHCVEEKVDLFWPLVKSSPRFSKIDFDENCMLHYWIDKKGGSVIPSSFLIRNGRTINLISKCCNMRLRLALEYLFELLDTPEKIARIDLWFSDTQVPWYLLPLLDATSQRFILDKFGLRVFHGFFQDPELIKYAAQAWFYIKDSLTMDRFYRDLIIPCLQYKNQDNFENRHRCSMEKTLAEIWSTSQLDWRHHTLNFHFPDILIKLNCYVLYSSRDFDRNIEFLLAMLSDADANLRNRFWTENWSKWIKNVPPAQFEDLMTLCLVETEVIDDFKRKLPDTKMFKYYCDTLMAKGLHRKMDEFINTLYTNPDRALSIKKHILENETSVFKDGHKRSEVWEHGKYIDGLFSNQALADDFKYRMILSDKVWQIVCDKIDLNNFHDARGIVYSLVTSNKREEFEGKLFEVFRSRLANGKLNPFDKRCWENYLHPVCGNHRIPLINDFKKSLPINQIFEASFSKYVNGNLPSVTLKSFFLWYFNSKPRCKNFKQERIQYYERMRETNVKRIFGKDKKSVIDLMKKSLY